MSGAAQPPGGGRARRPAPTQRVSVQRARAGALAPDARRLRAWAAAALAAPPGDASRGGLGDMTIRLVGVEESRALNRRWRGVDRPTDVLAFPAAAMPEAPDGAAALTPLGDLAVCAPVVRAAAHAAGGDPLAHWARVVVHGVLHLLGHDHERGDAMARRMASLERECLARAGFDPGRPPQG